MSNSYRSLYSLPHYQYQHARKSQDAKDMAHKHRRHLHIGRAQLGKALVFTPSLLRHHPIFMLFIRYYRIFMYYYAVSVRSASFLMVNSSWTKSHIDAILQRSDPLLDTIHLIPPFSFLHLFTKSHGLTAARIVYPPCDTREMVKFTLGGREHVILSIAQFRFVTRRAVLLLPFFFHTFHN